MMDYKFGNGSRNFHKRKWEKIDAKIERYTIEVNIHNSFTHWINNKIEKKLSDRGRNNKKRREEIEENKIVDTIRIKIVNVIFIKMLQYNTKIFKWGVGDQCEQARNLMYIYRKVFIIIHIVILLLILC